MMIFFLFLKEEPEKNAFSGLVLWFLHYDIMSGFDPFFPFLRIFILSVTLKVKKAAST